MLTQADVVRIAHLARIELAPGEADAILGQMTGILGLIEELQAIDTAGVEPMAHARDVVQRQRADVVTETDRRNDYQSVAPAVENGLYLVPKVIE